MFYWELVQHDGTTLEIPPDLVEVVKRRMANGEPINTKSMMIPANQIKHFRQTSKPFNTKPLLEDVARAFKEAMLTEDGSVKARWVKKLITRSEWNKKYSHTYKRLPDEDGMVVVAFRLAIHDIDVNKTPYCNDSEVKILENS